MVLNLGLGLNLGLNLGLGLYLGVGLDQWTCGPGYKPVLGSGSGLVVLFFSHIVSSTKPFPLPPLTTFHCV